MFNLNTAEIGLKKKTKAVSKHNFKNFLNNLDVKIQIPLTKTGWVRDNEE